MQKRKRVDLSKVPSKKRKKTFAIEEITFDANAREDFLTGFHKRKLQRAKQAREEAAKKEKAERIEERKNLRAQRKQDLEKHVAEVNAMVKAANKGFKSESSDEEEEKTPAVNVTVEPLDTEDEYEDEDKHTTVRIEEVSVTRDGLEKAGDEDSERDKDALGDGMNRPESKDAGSGNAASQTKRIWSKERPREPKKKKKSFRYESKAERRVTRTKERSKNKRQAKERKGK